MNNLFRFSASLAIVVLTASWSLSAEAGQVKKKGPVRPAPPASTAPTPPSMSGRGAPISPPRQRLSEPSRPTPSFSEKSRPENRAPVSEGRLQPPARNDAWSNGRVEGGAPRPPRSVDNPWAGRPERPSPVQSRMPHTNGGAQRQSATGGFPSKDPATRRPGRPAIERPEPPKGGMIGPRLPVSERVSRVPARAFASGNTLSRGGKLYRQEPIRSGDRAYVRRTRIDSGEQHHGGQHAVDGHGGHGGGPGVAHGEHHDAGRYYHHHHWGHRDYWVYVHYWSYEPWFWGFYFTPFAAPWHYRWVWLGSPWHVTWAWYYQPYTYYAGPSYWVTDYTLARMLADEYERGYEAGQASMVGTPISEPVKEQLRGQVDSTAKAIQTEQSLLLETALADPNYLFIVDAPISGTTVDGGTCTLTGGDIIKSAAAQDPNVPAATMSVVTSKSGNCLAGSAIAVSYVDLQEMLNSFSEAVDDGLNELSRQDTPR